MRPSTPRLVDIAERAEVSVTTVSRILTGQRLSEFSEKTRNKVQKIAEEMDWRPNLVGRGMKTGRTDTVGVFMSPFDGYWTGVLYGVHDALLEAGKVPLVLWPHALVHPSLNADRRSARGDNALPLTGPATEERRELERINRIADRQVDAIISWPLHDEDARDRLRTLAARGRRVVLIDDEPGGGAPAATVSLDEQAAMAGTLKHLRGLGHKKSRIGYVGVDREHAWARLRHAAFAEAQPKSKALHLPREGDAADPLIIAFLKKHPKLTAVVAATDHIARRVIHAAAGLGRSVPGDLSITGYGHDTFGGGVDLLLTTVDQRPYEVGAAAAAAALATQPRAKPVLVPGDLLPGNSTATPGA